jgi:drug/metabolite transporter (DMT)-like permease
MWIGLLALFFSQICGGGITPESVKLGVKEIPPVTFTFLRFFLATILFLPFFLYFKKRNLYAFQYKHFFLLGFCLFINVALFAIGVQYTTVIMTQIIYVMTPVIVGVVGHIFLKETLTKEKLIGLSIALIGIFFLIYESSLKKQTLTLGTPFGNSMIFLAMMGYSGYILISRKLSKKYVSSTITFFGFIIASILLFLLIPVELSNRSFLMNKVTIVGIGSIIATALVGSILLYLLIQIGVKRTNALTVSLFSYLSPFFAAISSSFLFGERLTPLFLFGGLFIMGGVFYATTYTYLRRKRTKNV